MQFPTTGNRVAIQDGNRTITYGELSKLKQIERPPFFAHLTLESILYLLQSSSPFPLSFHLPLAQAKLHAMRAQESDGTTRLLTSGSSGWPKIAKLTEENLYYSALGAIEYFDLDPSDRLLLTLPYFHVGGIAIIWRALLSGACLVLPQSKDLSAEIVREKITHVSFVPVQLKRLRKRAYPSLKTVLLGGQAMPQGLGNYPLPIYISYGMTEMGSIICAAPWNREQILQTLPYRKVKITEDGEILVAGKTLFAGYLGEAPPKGLFATNDLGRLSSQGLQIIGRKDRQFISGGENIQPEEIEAALLSLEEVTSARVEVKEDPEYGARPVAYLSPFPIPHVEERLGELLPKFKIPVAFFPLQTQEKGAQLSR